MKGPDPQTLDGSKLRIGIVHARWNAEIADALVCGAKAKLVECGVPASHIIVQSVPGSWELPIAVQRLQHAATSMFDPLSPMLRQSAPFDALIAIGVLIKGATKHFEYISSAATEGLMRVSLEGRVPVILGVLTALTEEQARERAGLREGGHNHGEDWGLAAVEMGLKVEVWNAGRFVEG